MSPYQRRVAPEVEKRGDGGCRSISISQMLSEDLGFGLNADEVGCVLHHVLVRAVAPGVARHRRSFPEKA